MVDWNLITRLKVAQEQVGIKSVIGGGPNKVAHEIIRCKWIIVHVEVFRSVSIFFIPTHSQDSVIELEKSVPSTYLG